MKVLLVILKADPARGGAERYTADLAGDLAALGLDVSIAAGSFGAPIAGVRFVPLAMNGMSRLQQYRRFVASLERHLGEQAYDIVHAMLPVPRCDFYHPHAGVAADAVHTSHQKYRSPLARTSARLFNQFNRKRHAFADVERRLLGRPDGPPVICLSAYIRAAVRRHYPLPDERLPILFNGTDLRRFDPADRPESRAAIRRQLDLAETDLAGLIIAQDFERKGLAEAIEATAQVADERVRLIVVGKPDPASYRRLAERLGVAGRIRFAGTTDRPDDFYRAADFFILPTRHDPCSLVVLEALSMGLPVISTRFNGACEVMTPGTHGFVIENPADVPAFASAIHQCNDPLKLAHMKSACLALRPALSQEHHVKRLVELYETIHR